jgi:hypothetical protein
MRYEWEDVDSIAGHDIRDPEVGFENGIPIYHDDEA